MRPTLNRLALLIIGVLVAAACGSGGATPTVLPSPANAETQAPPTAGGQETEGTPGAAGTASVRLINLYAPKDQAPPSIDLYVGRQAQPGDTPLVQVGFGQVSDFVTAPAEEPLTVYPAGRLDPESRQDATPATGFVPGDRITIVVHGVTRLASYLIVEAGNRASGAEWPAVPPGKALVLIYPGPLVGAVPADLESFFWVLVGAGCLTALDDGQPLAFGGNVGQFAAINPGTVEIAGASDGCGAAPVIGPVKLEVKAGDRLAIFPYGTGPEDLRLLVVPMPQT